MSEMNPYRPPVDTGPAPSPASPQAQPSRGYVPGGGVAKAAIVLLTIIAAVAGVGLLAWSLVVAAYLSAVVRPWVYALVAVVSGTNVIALCLRVALLIVFCAWFYRIYANVKYAFQVGGLKYSPAWASGAFFVPILNLFVPYRIAREIYVGSHSGIQTVSGRKAAAIKSGWIPLWWTLLLAMTGTALLADYLATTAPFFSSATAVLTQLITIAGAWVTVLMIREVEALQCARTTATVSGEPEAAEPDEPVVLKCPQCGVAYDPDDYNPEAAHIYCTTCKAELPRLSPGA